MTNDSLLLASDLTASVLKDTPALFVCAFPCALVFGNVLIGGVCGLLGDFYCGSK